jgi:CheY-like chemotaxis protein
MKVLVIEDNPHNAELMVLRLGTLECEPRVAPSAPDGLRQAREWRPDLILLDLKLDGERDRGVQLLGELREDPLTTDIPVIIHSIYVSHRDEMPRLGHHADGLLLKPFKFQDLRQLIDGVRAGGAD